MKAKILKPEFVEELPQTPLEGVLYISMEHSIAMHLCPCGCGNKVFTPFSQNQWRLVFNRRVTLKPSIGNFSLPCHSHYFITNDEIRWCSDDYEDYTRRKRHKQKKRQKNFLLNWLHRD